MRYYIVGGCLYSSESLSHSGVKNQKWGVRRYQNADGSLTALGRIHYGIGQARQAAATAKKKKARAKQLEKARAIRAKNAKARAEEAEKKAKYEAEKEKALKTGSAKDILKYIDDLSAKQINEAADKLNAQKRLSDIVATENDKIAKGMSAVKRASDTLSTAASAISNATNAYNAFAKVYNSFSRTDKKLNIIGEKQESPLKKKITKIIKSGTLDDIKEITKDFDANDWSLFNARFQGEKNIDSWADYKETRKSDATERAYKEAEIRRQRRVDAAIRELASGQRSYKDMADVTPEMSTSDWANMIKSLNASDELARRILKDEDAEKYL